MHCDVTYSLESTAGGIFSKLTLVMFQSTPPILGGAWFQSTHS